MGKNITASIVIYNSDKQELEKVISAISNSCIGYIYIVDNSPTNSAEYYIRGLSNKIDYIWGQGNVGYGSGHNIAIRKSIENRAKYHIIVNPDIFFEKNTIEQLFDYMEKNDKIGQLMPRVVYPNGELQYLCKLLPTPMDLIGRRFILNRSMVEKRNKRFELRQSGYDKVMNVPFLSGCFMFFRVEALEKVGGFDEDFFMYCEDIDLCRRISMEGYETIYLPDVTIIHAHKKESFRNNKMLIIHINSAFKYFNKWGWIFDKYRSDKNNKCIENLQLMQNENEFGGW